MFDEWKGKVWIIILAGLLGAPALYVVAFLFEFFICFCTCAGVNYNCSIPIWSGAAFGGTFAVLSIAGIVIGVIYAIAAGTQEGREEWTRERAVQNRKRGGSVGDAIRTIGIVKNKSDTILSLIKDAEKTIFSANARTILEEASIGSNESALALEKEARIVENVRGKTSKIALKNAQQAEEASRWSEKDVDLASDLYNQALKEENDWNRVQKEANDAVDSAKKASKNAAQEAVKIEKMTFTSASAKDAVEKAAYAFARSKEAENETVKRRDTAATASSAQKAQIELSQAKYSEKRAIVEAKIAVEEVKIAVEAEKKSK